ncbi:hypothetical protein AAZX31_09G210100 [Glycine max]|uniref:Uncharacterized protein n=2 Tax=Glycine subgen. Soja TaxID=1462606 RepID=K7LFJ5_SOYBN|nr:hypothetical protein D0Y65_025011 [Glycine soja]
MVYITFNSLFMLLLCYQMRKKCTVQHGQNGLVLKELDLLKDDANVYKLIGPVRPRSMPMSARGSNTSQLN